MTMTFNPELKVPWGYSTGSKRLVDARAVLLVHYHPEYVRRLLAWLTSKDGLIGVGGTWRPQGGQPVKPGFAPEGKSFHQDQAYKDGLVGACAVDLVAANPGHIHRTVKWSEVIAQGSAEAKRWGVHCNIATEAWHMQPVEIDGWQSWWNTGRPGPVAGYPIPGETPTPPPAEDEDMLINNDILDDIDSAPPVAAMDAPANPDTSRWFTAAVIAAMFKQLTGSKTYTQAAAEKLNALLED